MLIEAQNSRRGVLGACRPDRLPGTVVTLPFSSLIFPRVVKRLSE